MYNDNKKTWQYHFHNVVEVISHLAKLNVAAFAEP